MEQQLLEKINRNMEVVIGLLLQSLPNSEAASLGDRVLMLERLGMRPTDIARVLGKSTNHINKELSVARRKAKEN